MPNLETDLATQCLPVALGNLRATNKNNNGKSRLQKAQHPCMEGMQKGSFQEEAAQRTLAAHRSH